MGLHGRDINTVLAHDKAMFDVDVETEDRAIRGAPLTPALAVTANQAQGPTSYRGMEFLTMMNQ